MSTWSVEVAWDGAAVAGVTAVSPLSRTTEVIEYRDISSSTAHRLPGRLDVATVRIERDLSTDLAFTLWAFSPLVRKEVTLAFVDPATDVRVAYRLSGCWVCGLEVTPDVAGGRVRETLVLSLDGWERLTPPVLQIADDLARSRGAEVRRVDARTLVGKNASETTANLSRVLDEADRSGAVLVVDEADALFARRAGVRDAHDRYANAETSALLDRLAAHEGPVLVTPPDPHP